MNYKPAYFPALTGIRAIAALMVYLHHVNPIPNNFPQLKLFLDKFYVGVSFFFVLSGLLIGLRYYGTEMNWKKYLIYRAARIYPMWLILTLVTFSVGYSYNQNWLKLLFVNLTFLKGFNYNLCFTGIEQGWTLTVEECFYFTAPFLIFLLSKKKYLAFVIPLLFLLVGFILMHLCALLNIDAFQNINFILISTFFGRSWEFLWGLLLALLYKKYSKKINSIYKFPGLNLIFLICIVIVIFAMSQLPYSGKNEGSIISEIILNNFILPLFTGTFYLGLMVKKDFFVKVLSTPIAIIGGKASYIFYLIHIGVIRNFLSSFIDPIFPDNIWRWTLKNISLVTISIVMYYLLEEPLNKFVKKIFIVKEI